MATGGVYDYMLNIRFNASELVSIAVDSVHNEFPEMRARSWTAAHWDFCVQMCGYYFILIVLLQFFMRKREPFNLSIPMSAWNLGLALFYSWGAASLAPDFLGTLFGKGFHASVCSSEGHLSGRSGFVAWILALMKLAEFGDTIFVILRKRPLHFLHWYQHIMTALFFFLSFPQDNAFNRWGLSLHCGINAVMYLYYAVSSMGMKIPRSIAQAVTTLQMGQLALALALLAKAGFTAFVQGEKCDLHFPSFVVAGIMNMSYLALFANYYANTYIFKKAATKKVEEKKMK